MGERDVGPVLTGGATGWAVARAILASNAGATVDDRGGYLRIRAPAPCQVHSDSIRDHLGSAFQLPGDLERIMPSFCGRFVVEENVVRWE